MLETTHTSTWPPILVTSWGQREPLIKLDTRPAWREKLRKNAQTSGHSPVPTRALYTGKVILQKPRGLSSPPIVNQSLTPPPSTPCIKFHITSFTDELDFFITTGWCQLTPIFFQDETLSDHTLSSLFLALIPPSALENYFKRQHPRRTRAVIYAACPL